ncbi:Avr9/Cf-9 rapidly elicited protein [Melia azedarach]|uniref:Avr9/Cf-9 rapidly elicited protein n=1 Tax=Melia azedarach TaxID=155640 RepID=A0ACC1X0D7_MELAZ|nr:Avr9/Cf-9 rapidly elicited protein [Melia azedarach]
MATMSWLSGTSSKATHHHLHTRSLFRLDRASSVTLGILSFETAKTMCRLIHLYNSLSDDEFSRLRKVIMKSQGVAFLNSKDERFLLSLVCAEKLEDLNRAVNTVSRLSQKCSDVSLIRFDQTYLEMHLGVRELCKLEYASKGVEKLVEKMEKYVKATANLHTALECLAEMEISERKIKKWKKNLGPKQANKANTDYFDEKINNQRKQVKHYRDVSLWNQTFDQSVGLMSRIITIIYARICVLFSPFVPDLPRPSKHIKPISHQKPTRVRVHPDHTNHMQCKSKSGPIHKASRKFGSIRAAKSGPLTKSDQSLLPDNRIPLNIGKNKRVLQLATESTVGGAGLSLRYANIIIHAERYLHAPTNIDDEARAHLYELLPENLKLTVRGKLWGHWCTRGEVGSNGYSLAEGWREALEEMMTWLGPVAHDTVKWQQERYLEKQRFDAKPTVMLFQTMYFSDLEKTEAAIVEVLVGLSCIYSGFGLSSGVKD